VLGVAYKRDIDDVREVSRLDMILLMERKGTHVTYSDLYVSTLRFGDRRLRSGDTLLLTAKANCTSCRDHSTFDYPPVLSEARIIVDARNVFRGQVSNKLVRF